MGNAQRVVRHADEEIQAALRGSLSQRYAVRPLLTACICKKCWRAMVDYDIQRIGRTRYLRKAITRSSSTKRRDLFNRVGGEKTRIQR